MRSWLPMLALAGLVMVSSPADPAQVTFQGMVEVVDVDEVDATYHGTVPGDTVSATFSYPDICDATCVAEPFPPEEVNYAFEAGSASWTFTLNGTQIGGSRLSVAIQDDLVLDAETAALVSDLLGMTVPKDTVVDVWTVSGITDGADDDPDLVGGSEIEFVKLSLDSSLFDSKGFRPMPPPLNATDLAVFFVEEAAADAATLFVAQGEIVPEPSMVAMLGTAISVLTALRRRVPRTGTV